MYIYTQAEKILTKFQNIIRALQLLYRSNAHLVKIYILCISFQKRLLGTFSSFLNFGSSKFSTTNEEVESHILHRAIKPVNYFIPLIIIKSQTEIFEFLMNQEGKFFLILFCRKSEAKWRFLFFC